VRPSTHRERASASPGSLPGFLFMAGRGTFFAPVPGRGGRDVGPQERAACFRVVEGRTSEIGGGVPDKEKMGLGLVAALA